MILFISGLFIGMAFALGKPILLKSNWVDKSIGKSFKKVLQQLHNEYFYSNSR